MPDCYVCLVFVFFLFQNRNISKLAEVCKECITAKKETEENEKPSESEEEKINLLVKLKIFC